MGFAALAFTLGGCAGDRELLSQVPQKSGTSAVEYQTLSECVATRLDQPGLIKNDFPTERRSRLSVDSGGVRYFEINFRGTAPNSTDWSVGVVNTVWGAFPGLAEKATTAISACSAPLPSRAAVAVPVSTLTQRIEACGLIDDMTKERLDCFDAIAIPRPAPPGPATVVVKCRAVAAQDARLLCFDKLLIVRSAPPKAAPHRRPPVKHYVRHGRGGCGSRGGPGYRLPNGKCASWHR